MNMDRSALPTTEELAAERRKREEIARTVFLGHSAYATSQHIEHCTPIEPVRGLQVPTDTPQLSLKQMRKQLEAQMKATPDEHMRPRIVTIEGRAVGEKYIVCENSYNPEDTKVEVISSLDVAKKPEKVAWKLCREVPKDSGGEDSDESAGEHRNNEDAR